MKVSIEKMNLVIIQAKRLIQLQKELDRHNSKLETSDGKQRQRFIEAGNFTGFAIEKQLHELHCVCVEAGAADIREDKYYGTRIMKVNGWNEQKVEFRKPKI